MEYFKEHKRGIIGTFIFHLIVLLLLMLLGFFTPLPLPGEEGILVNFGNSKNGFGNREPSPANRNPKPVVTKKKEQPKPKQKEVIPKATTPPPATTPKPKPAKEVAMTQDFEKTAAIDAAEKKKRDEEKKKQEKLNEERRQKKIEEERIRKAEIEKERKKQEELERKRKQEAEQKAREEAERKKREEEQRKIDEINSRTQSAFANKGSGSGGKGSNDGKSQGATFPGGNQGVKTGDANAGNYGAGGSGTGNQGTEIWSSLGSRLAISLPPPTYPGNDEGTVVIEITVDKYGKVINVKQGRGSTTTNQKLLLAAKQAALKAKFMKSPNGTPLQKGTITYRFKLH
jgi:TonB family protein